MKRGGCVLCSGDIILNYELKMLNVFLFSKFSEVATDSIPLKYQIMSYKF